MAGLQPRLPRPHPRARFVAYVCMTPKSWASEDTLRQRVKVREEEEGVWVERKGGRGGEERLGS